MQPPRIINNPVCTGDGVAIGPINLVYR